MASSCIRVSQSAVERGTSTSPAGARRAPPGLGAPLRSPSGSYSSSSPAQGYGQVGCGSGPTTPNGRLGSQRYSSSMGHPQPQSYSAGGSPQGYGSAGSAQPGNYYRHQQGYAGSHGCQPGSHVLRTHSNMSGWGDQYCGVDMPTGIMSACNSPNLSPSGQLDAYPRAHSHPPMSPSGAAAAHNSMHVPPGHVRTASGRVRMYGPPEVMSPRRQGSGNYGPVVTTLSRFAAPGGSSMPQGQADVYTHQYQNGASGMPTEYCYPLGNGYGYQQGPGNGVGSPGTSRSSSLNGGWTSPSGSNSSSAYRAPAGPQAAANAALGRRMSRLSRDLHDDESDDDRPRAPARAVTDSTVGAGRKPVQGGPGQRLGRDLSYDDSDDDEEEDGLFPVMRPATRTRTAPSAAVAAAAAAAAHGRGMQKKLSRDLSADSSDDDDGLRPVMKANTGGSRSRAAAAAAAAPQPAVAATASGRGGRMTLSRDLSNDDSENDGSSSQAVAASRRGRPAGSCRERERQPQPRMVAAGHPRPMPQQKMARSISEDDSDVERRAAGRQGGAGARQQPQQMCQQQPRHQQPQWQLSRNLSDDSSDEECSIAHPPNPSTGGNQGRLVCKFSDDDSEVKAFVAAAPRRAPRPTPSSQQQQQQQQQQQHQHHQQQRPARQQPHHQQLQRRFSDDEDEDDCYQPQGRGQANLPQQQQRHMQEQGNAGITGGVTYPPHNKAQQRKPAGANKVVRCMSDDDSDREFKPRPKQAAAKPQGMKSKKPAQQKVGGKPMKIVRK